MRLNCVRKKVSVRAGDRIRTDDVQLGKLGVSTVPAKKTFAIGSITLHLGDAREVLPHVKADAIITDPPWDQAKGYFADDPRAIIEDIAPQLARSRMIAVQLGCFTDPSLLSPIAALMPFFHTCWLRYMPPSYRGRILVDADVAYVYGVPPKSREGARVIPAFCPPAKREAEEREFVRGHGRNRSHRQAHATFERLSHPAPRHLNHVRWLMKWHAESSDVVADPFLGSGTAAVAAIQLGRVFVGIERDPVFFDLACKRVSRAAERQLVGEAVVA